VRVIALGVGTAGGAMIPDGNGGFVKDERGAVVLSRLESGTLQELAQATGGTYRDASGWIDLAALIKDTVEAGRKGQFVEKNTVRLVERFQWPLALAWWCLLVSFYFEFPVRPRVRDVKLTPPNAGHRKPAPETRATAVAVAVLLCGLLLPRSSFAAVQIAPASPPRPARPAIGSPAAEPEPAGPALGKIFRRLATQDRLSAQDYAEIARETVLWGNRIKEGGHRVPTGPVKDALQAVDELMRIDSRSTDWTKLRRELEALLENNEEKPPEQQPQPNQKDQQNQDKKNQDQSQQKQSSGGQQPQPSPEQKDGQPKDQQDQNQPSDQKNKPDAQKPPGESAFGNMKEKSATPPPPPPGDTQKVGGVQEKKDAPNEPADPTLALPLQKLDQLRNQDSPAQLFQLMDADRKPVKKPAKDW
jgi:Ca-activated chloride channel homolog